MAGRHTKIGHGKSRGNQGKSGGKDTLFWERMTAEFVSEILWPACSNFHLTRHVDLNEIYLGICQFCSKKSKSLQLPEN